MFFTLCLADRGGDLLCREVTALRAAVSATRAERPFGILAWVVLPDHLHCIWTLPEGDADYSTRWGAIKARFTRRVGLHPTDPTGGMVGYNPTPRRSASKVAKGDAGIWQRRFWEHHIRNEADLDNHLRYCWWNPVRHGLVGHPADWPLSSIHRDMRLGPMPPEWSTPPDGTFGE